MCRKVLVSLVPETNPPDTELSSNEQNNLISNVGYNTLAQDDDCVVSCFCCWLPLISGLYSQGLGDGLLLLHSAIPTTAEVPS